MKDNWSRPPIRAFLPCEFNATLFIAISVSMTEVDISIHHCEYEAAAGRDRIVQGLVFN